MSWRSFPPSTPALLLRHAVLLVEWLRLANVLKRWRSECTSGVRFLAAAGVMLAVVAVIALSSRIAVAVKLLADYWVLTAIVTAVYAASSVARRRRRMHELHLQSWLVAVPVPQSSLRASQAIRTLLPTFAQFLAVGLFVLLIEWMATQTQEASKVIAAIAAGLFVGAAVGWRASVDHSAARSLASRYVPSKQRGGTMRPDGHALSKWPIAQVLAWSRPENSRYVLIVALFAVQGGSSAILGLSVVALYFICSYLAALLSALLHVARMAGAWLCVTPMALSEFVWNLSVRALVHQAFGTALVAVFMLLLGVPLASTLQVAALWLGLVISISGCALVDGYRRRSPAMKIALSVLAWATFAAVLQFKAVGRA